MVRVVPFLLAAVLVATHSPSAAMDDPPGAPKVDPKKDKKGGIDRSGATRKRLLKDFGGSPESEEAVMLGLAWLTQTQNPDGSWSFDRGVTRDKAAATGLALLAFLGAGQSHQEGRYKQTVQAGLDWMVKQVEMDRQARDQGRIETTSNMYSQGIATLALCEAYGMTRDRTLKYPTQAAINYIQRAQAANGSWGYQSGNAGDTSIVGWQIQALYAAKLTQDLEVDEKVIEKAIKFLDYVGVGNSQEGKSMYGYTTPARAAPGTSLTAVGLLCRYYISDWRADTNGFANGTRGLMKRAPSATPQPPELDLYYYYYATQVVRYHGGKEWKTWNEGAKQPDGTRRGGVPEWLISLQSKRDKDRGSWDPGREWIGSNCGRHGMTCLCLLTLEVYYRYDPTQQQGGEKKEEPKKDERKRD